jgi:hypothetical protein
LNLLHTALEQEQRYETVSIVPNAEKEKSGKKKDFCCQKCEELNSEKKKNLLQIEKKNGEILVGKKKFCQNCLKNYNFFGNGMDLDMIGQYIGIIDERFNGNCYDNLDVNGGDWYCDHVVENDEKNESNFESNFENNFVAQNCTKTLVHPRHTLDCNCLLRLLPSIHDFNSYGGCIGQSDELFGDEKIDDKIEKKIKIPILITRKHQRFLDQIIAEIISNYNKGFGYNRNESRLSSFSINKDGEPYCGDKNEENIENIGKKNQFGQNNKDINANIDMDSICLPCGLLLHIHLCQDAIDNHSISSRVVFEEHSNNFKTENGTKEGENFGKEKDNEKKTNFDQKKGQNVASKGPNLKKEFSIKQSLFFDSIERDNYHHNDKVGQLWSEKNGEENNYIPHSPNPTQHIPHRPSTPTNVTPGVISYAERGILSPQSSRVKVIKSHYQ